jgi:enoyl-CoA hydratase/carnithine racemase
VPDTEFKVARAGDVALVTIDNGEDHTKPTFFGRAALASLEQALDELESGDFAALVLTGKPFVFAAGADVTEFPDATADLARAGSRAGHELFGRLGALPYPTVAAINGVCLGGGLELALSCDYIVAATSAKIGSVEATLGLHPLLGGIQRQVQRIGAARAKEMSMLARRYDAPTLEKWGLINLTVSEEALFNATLSVAEEFAQGPTLAHAATKELVHIAVNEGVDAADAAMTRVQAPIWASEDLKAGLASFRKNGPGLAKFAGR